MPSELVLALVATVGPLCVFRLWWIWWTRTAGDDATRPRR
jgi:hypothetical protein